MQFVQELSTLLQLIHDSDDEYVALKRGCSWVRENAGADAVGIVASEGTSVVAADGLQRHDLENIDLKSASHSASTFDVRESVVVSAPMRYAGVTIGFAVLRGSREAAGTLTEAGKALASACAWLRFGRALCRRFCDGLRARGRCATDDGRSRGTTGQVRPGAARG